MTYLPRIATLVDRVLTKIGLNGRAVIPMILGLGCVTMATINSLVSKKCITAKSCSRCSFLLKETMLVCPRCRQPVEAGCSGNCATF